MWNNLAVCFWVSMSFVRAWVVGFVLLSLLSGQERGAIAGHIVDAAGAAIPDSLLILHGAGGEVARIHSDDRGVFQFPNLAPGEYSIGASSNGFDTKQVLAIRVIGNAITTIEIEMVVRMVDFGCEPGPEFEAYSRHAHASEIMGAVQLGVEGSCRRPFGARQY